MKEILNDLIAEASVVDALVSGLSEKQWDEIITSDMRVGDIPGIWSIRDTVAHISLFDEAAGRLVMGEFDDLAVAVPPGVQDEHYRVIPQGKWKKDEILSWWRYSRTKMAWGLYNRDPKARIPWAPGMPMSARSLASARLMELWAHSVDIYDQLGLPVHVEDRISHTLFLSWQARQFAYSINGAQVPDTPIYLELVLPSGAVWSKGEPGAQNYIKGSALDWALTAIRRRNWMDTELEVSGEEARRYASFVQTYAKDADDAPVPKRQR